MYAEWLTEAGFGEQAHNGLQAARPRFGSQPDGVVPTDIRYRGLS